MKHDEILQAAKEAGLFTRVNGYYAVCHKTQIERFAAIIEKRTIERCAVEAYEWTMAYVIEDNAPITCTAAIRKLGEQE